MSDVAPARRAVRVNIIGSGIRLPDSHATADRRLDGL
jgi:hypothetical protein